MKKKRASGQTATHHPAALAAGKSKRVALTRKSAVAAAKSSAGLPRSAERSAISSRAQRKFSAQIQRRERTRPSNPTPRLSTGVEIHDIYYEECGNPAGKPALFLHGGPGAGSDRRARHSTRALPASSYSISVLPAAAARVPAWSRTRLAPGRRHRTLRKHLASNAGWYSAAHGAALSGLAYSEAIRNASVKSSARYFPAALFRNSLASISMALRKYSRTTGRPTRCDPVDE